MSRSIPNGPSLHHITRNIDKALNGIKSAAVPDRVSQDFVKTILKIPGGSGDQMTSFLKKLGLSTFDGTPTELYRKFRNPVSSGNAIASAIKAAYAPLYVRNEFVHKLDEPKLIGLIVEETGEAHDSNPVKLIASCIKHLKAFSDFSSQPEAQQQPLEKIETTKASSLEERRSSTQDKHIGFNLGYTINLNLPATSDAAVFDAIFKSLKAHLLRDEDA